MNPLAIFPKKAVRLLLALVAAGSLIFAVGCGSGSNNGGGGGGGNQGFSKASLNGNYAFTLRGVGTTDQVNFFFFVEGGVFTADGNGTLTAITEDFVGDFASGIGNQLTGTYFINSDGTGELFFSNNASYSITLSDDSHFYMVEDEGFNTSAGSGEKQTTSAFAAVPSGTFVLQTHDLLAGNSKVGVAAWTAGNIVGTGDVLSGGTLSPVNVTGTVQAPSNTTGRGTVTVVDDTGTSHYVYYVVNSGKLRLLNTDALTSLGLGVAEAQAAGPFSSASLNGNFVFGSAGETGNVDGLHTVGLITADGAGNITDGSFDFVQDGTAVTSVSLNGANQSSYSVNGTTGRIAVTLHLSTGLTNKKVLYLVSPSRALFLVNDPINIEDGTMDKQSGTFTKSSLNGQAAMVMDGFDETQGLFEDFVGTVTPNGTGGVRTDFVFSFFDPNAVVGGSQGPLPFPGGTYDVGANGRATAQFPGFTNNMVYYLSNTNTGYFLEADDGIDMGGVITNQAKQ